MSRLRLDPAPLLQLAEQRVREHEDHDAHHMPLEDRMVTAIADLLGVSTRCVHHWRTGRATVPPMTADRLAIRLGTHMDLLWPELSGLAPTRGRWLQVKVKVKEVA